MKGVGGGGGFSEVAFRIGLCGATCRVTHALQGGNQVGAVALADSLKDNTCLTELHLVSEGGRGYDMGIDCVFVVIHFIFLFSIRFFVFIYVFI